MYSPFVPCNTKYHYRVRFSLEPGFLVLVFFSLNDYFRQNRNGPKTCLHTEILTEKVTSSRNSG